MIIDKVLELDKACNNQKEAFERVTQGATLRYQELETIINYFEHEMLIVSFSALPGLV